MADRVRGTHQRRQAATRSQSLPVQRREWNEALGRARRDLRQSHQHRARHRQTDCEGRTVTITSVPDTFTLPRRSPWWGFSIVRYAPLYPEICILRRKVASPTTVVTGLRAKWGVSDCGQLMGAPSEAGLASIEPEGVYEHMAVGVLEEGYTLVYKTAPGGPDHVKYDVYQSSSGI